MIAYQDVVNTINRVLGWREGIEAGPLEKQLSASLKVYWNRKEFDGTVVDAHLIKFKIRDALAKARGEVTP